MCATFSLRQAKVAQRLSFLLDQAEGVARAISDNAIDNADSPADQISPLTAANWHQQLQRIQRIINPS